MSAFRTLATRTSPAGRLPGGALIGLFGLGLSALMVPALAATLHVAPSGSGDYTTIQAALDAAPPGSTIELADGVFRGPGNRDLDLRGKSLTLRSTSGDPARCVIDCGGTPAEPHRAFDFHGLETSDCLIADLTITGGFAGGSRAGGGAVRCTGGARPTFSQVIFTANRAAARTTGGGAVYCSGDAAPTFIDCAFLQGEAPYGAGLYCWRSAATLIGCRFEGNAAAIHGGGLYIGNGSPTVSGCTFTANRACGQGSRGGGIYVIDGRPVLLSCHFRANAARHGRDCSVQAAHPTLLDCAFQTQCPAGTPAAAEREAIHVQAGSCAVAHCAFTADSGGTRAAVLHR